MRSAGPCIRCKCDVWLPDELYDAAQRAAPKMTFYCAYGHPMVFAVGESDLQKVTRERDRLFQRLAQKDDEIKELENRRRAAVGQVTKLKNRVGHGVCPCCNRTFENVARHMASQHPTFTAEAAE